jgi:zinc protease
VKKNATRDWFRVLVFFAGLACGTLASAGESVLNQGYTLPLPQIETLPNGLEVVWFISDRIPVIDLGISVQAGFRDDPSGKSGVAELLSSALARGAGGLSAQQVAHAIEILGATHFETAGDDSFTAGIHGLSPDADQLLELLGKIVTQSTLSEKEVNREKARIAERWKHIGDYAEIMAGMAYRRILASGTPYGRGSLLNLKEFRAIEPKDVRDFYQKYFIPRNSLLMVVGRVDKAQFRQKILSVFGTWGTGKGEPPVREKHAFSDPRFIGEFQKSASKKSGLKSGLNSGLKDKSHMKIFVVDRPGLNQAQVRMGFRAPSIQVPEHHALVVGNALLGEYFYSRLNALIRDQLGLTYGIGSAFSYSLDLSEFTISSSTRNESVGELVQKSLDVLGNLKKGPIAAEEVAAAKEYLVGGFPLSTSTLQAVASRWLGGRVLGVKPSYLNEYVPRIQSVSAAEVQSAIQKYFDLDQLIVVVSGDAKTINESLSKFKLAAVKQMSVSDLQ